MDVLRDLPRRSHAPLVVRAQDRPVKDLVWTVYNILLAEMLDAGFPGGVDERAGLRDKMRGARRRG